MRIKKFQAENIAEALRIVRDEFGENALILSTKKLQSTSKKARESHGIEVVAAIDEAAPSGRFTNVDFDEPRASLARAAAPQKQNYASRMYARESLPPTASHAGSSEIGALRNELAKIGSRLERRIAAPEADGPYGSSNPFLQKLQTFLQVAGVHHDIVNKVIGQLSIRVPQRAFETEKGAREVLQRTFSDFFRTASSAVDHAHPPCTIAILGPTGVGKTTSLAKIAACLKLEKKLEVGLVSIDTFRIGAIEQLRTFANIARLPLKIAYDQRELREAIDGYAGLDVILIDTPGSSPRNASQIDRLKSYLETAGVQERYLALSASTRFAELEEIALHYAPVEFNRVLLTKIDEIMHPVSLLNIQKLTPAPLAFVTNGQRIPEDLVFASAEALASIIMNEWNLAAWIN